MSANELESDFLASKSNKVFKLRNQIKYTECLSYSYHTQQRTTRCYLK